METIKYLGGKNTQKKNDAEIKDGLEWTKSYYLLINSLYIGWVNIQGVSELICTAVMHEIRNMQCEIIREF